MRILCLISIACILANYAKAQTFAIGHTQISFHDASRNRDVTTEIYYPAAIAGNDVPVDSGTFPTIVFGHGFVMVWSSYQNVWEALVPDGYVLVFATTEGSFAPDHFAFAEDLNFLLQTMTAENINNNSIFYSHLSNNMAIMGHSMGGGASLLAIANNTSLKAMIGLAPAETTPSAIDVCGEIVVPVLIFSGENDGVTPPADHQIPMYNALSGVCKTHVTILGGGHCFFANTDALCELGESFSNPQPTITRNEQQAIYQPLMHDWFDYYLKNDLVAGQNFTDALQSSTEISFNQMNCSITNSQGLISKQDFSIYPNPADEFIRIENGNELEIIMLHSMDGKLEMSFAPSELIPLAGFSDGIYLLTGILKDAFWNQKIIIIR